MKLNEVLNWKGPTAKLKRLELLLTPQVMADNHEAMLNIIASKLSVQDIDELEAELSGSMPDSESLDFSLKMMQKALGSFGKTNVDINGNGHHYVQANFEHASPVFGQSLFQKRTGFVSAYFHRGVWFVSGSSVNFSGGFTDKKVKTAKEALELMKAHVEKILKKFPLSLVGKPNPKAKK